MVTNFDQVLDKLKGMPAKTIAVAWGHFEEVLLALKEAQQQGIARTVIFGEKEKADKLGVECHLLIPGVSKSATYTSPEQFLIDKLTTN